MVGRAGTPATRGCEPRQARKGAAAAAQRVLGRGRYGPPPLERPRIPWPSTAGSQGQGAARSGAQTVRREIPGTAGIRDPERSRFFHNL